METISVGLNILGIGFELIEFYLIEKSFGYRSIQTSTIGDHAEAVQYVLLPRLKDRGFQMIIIGLIVQMAALMVQAFFH